VSVERNHDLEPAWPSLMALIAHRAQLQPDALALLTPARAPLSFAALVREVARTMRSLTAFGLGAGSRIALALENSPEAVVLLLAATEGATCAPLNPASDLSLARSLLEKMRVDALIVAAGQDSAAVQAAVALGLPIVRIERCNGGAAGALELSAPRRRASDGSVSPPLPEDIVLLLHTSGTTGTPKVAPLTRRNIIESAVARARHLSLTGADRCLCLAPMFAASGIRRNLFPSLGAGAGVICVPKLDPTAFPGWLESFRPTFYTGSPTIHRSVLDALRRHGGKPRHALRFAISASAPLTPELQQQIEIALGVPVIQAYATSEAGTIAQEPLPPGERRPGSIGLPADGEVAIFDDEGRRCGPGEIGEIAARGPEVFDAYEGDDAANRAAFRDGWFRTGDLGHLDEAGYLYITGRVKELINRGGMKVSPAEVDAVLLRHAEVVEAATFALSHATLGEDVIAAVVLREPARVTTRELRDFAFEHLAAFKVPTRIIAVSRLPHTALGKIRRTELPELLSQDLNPGNSAPRGTHEELVALFFAEILGAESVGADDNFFDLGGDSLRGAQLVARVNAALGLDLDPTSLFRRPTVAEFALHLGQAPDRGAAALPPPTPPATERAR